MDRRAQLQQMTRYTSADTIAEAVAAAKRGHLQGRLQLTAAISWAAFACPDACPAVCDNIASAWFGSGPTPEVPKNLSEVTLGDSFWEAFWSVVDGPDEGYDAISITVAVASLAAAVPEELAPLVEQHALNHRGAAAAQCNPIPGYTDMSALANCPQDSLGYALHRLILDNGYDPEVLARDDLGFDELPHVLHYLNARILQMHEVWHLVAGYRTTAFGEIAISAYQLAQFGHAYSSMFLAAAMAIGTFNEPRGFNVLMQIITEGWQHGRESPVMMDIDWEQEWDSSLDVIRTRYSIPLWQSVFPQDFLETLEGGPLWRRLYHMFQLLRFNLRLRQNSPSPPPQLAVQ